MRARGAGDRAVRVRHEMEEGWCGGVRVEDLVGLLVPGLVQGLRGA